MMLVCCKAIEKGLHGFRYDGSRMGFEMRDKAGWGCALVE
jgi:hypothetical protein